MPPNSHLIALVFIGSNISEIHPFTPSLYHLFPFNSSCWSKRNIMLMREKKKPTAAKRQISCFQGLRGKMAHGHTHHKALQGPVVWVQQEAGHRAHLRSPVPAVRTVDKHTCPFLRNGLKNRIRKESTQNGCRHKTLHHN